MRIHEYQAREVLAPYNLPFAPGSIARTAEEAASIAEGLGGRVVVKAQVLEGGRGKVGGVKLACSSSEARAYAASMLASTVKGRPVHEVLVAQAVDVQQEYYLGVTVDRRNKCVAIAASQQGGVEIEDVARDAPEAISKITIDPCLGLTDFQARELARGCDLERTATAPFVQIAKSLFGAFVGFDCALLEINPLALDRQGRLSALDCKMVIDDSALYRQPVIAALQDEDDEASLEGQARQIGLSYIRLGGDIGCLVNGAGLAMATMDAIKRYGGEPANFLDIGGGPTVEKVAAAMEIILSERNVRVALVNIFGGITRCDVIAQGVLEALSHMGSRVRVVARLVGTKELEGRRLLENAGVPTMETMSEAARTAVRLAAGEERLRPSAATANEESRP